MRDRAAIVQSKLSKPALPRNFLKRKRLLETLASLEEPMVLLGASMGYGKTVVMTDFANENGCAWYHLDETDDDLMTFCRYFAGAIHQVLPEFILDTTLYVASSHSHTIARNLALDCVDELCQCDGQRVQIVLDDFHVIQNELVYLFLVTLLERSKGWIQVFLCTKSAMPAAFARMLLSQWMVSIGVEQLAFTKDEIYSLLMQSGVEGDCHGFSQQIRQVTEGWPVGVMYILIHLRNLTEIPAKDLKRDTFSPYMRDYFMHELYRKLPFDLQHFLATTAVLEYLEPAVCNLLTGRDNSSAQLAYLEQENLFIIRMAGGKATYRYHSLFREFLLTLSTASQRRERLAQAATYYLQTPESRWAVEYALASGNRDLLGQAVEQWGEGALERGDYDTLEHDLQTLKRLHIAPTPKIMVITGWYLQRTGQWQEAEQLALEMEKQDSHTWPPEVFQEVQQQLKALPHRQSGVVVQLEVVCFGEFRVVAPDGKSLTWRTRKTKELFAYLYHRAGEPASKERLMDLLWPQATNANGAALLHTSLYNIRKALAAYPGLSELVIHSKAGYSMSMDLVHSNRQVLDSLAKGGDYPKGLSPEALYAGQYLEDVEGTWCTDARAYYSGEMLNLFRRQAEQAMVEQEYRRALAFLRPASAQEPYDEDLAGALIRAYAALGEMKNAMNQYAKLRDCLKTDLDVEPSEEVTEIYRACLLKRLQNKGGGQ
ncbi:MAG: BTAD domain-containing putative transcriptional regulator [Eubacteriales bacterium]